MPSSILLLALHRLCIGVFACLALSACAGDDEPEEGYDLQLGVVEGAEVPFLVRVFVTSRADASGAVPPEELPRNRLRARVSGLTGIAEQAARQHCAPLRPVFEPDPVYIVAIDPAKGEAGTLVWAGGNPAPFMIELAFRCGA